MTEGPPPHRRVLLWGIKASFVAYVESLPDGRVELSRGAVKTEDGVFAFPAGGGDQTVAAFVGSVRFTGHHGALDVSVTDPLIERTGEGVSLTSPWGRAGERVRLAVIRGELPAGGEDWEADEVALTDDGAYLLGEAYSAGDRLDRLRILPGAAAGRPESAPASTG